MGLVSDPDIERDGSDAMYRAPVATLGLVGALCVCVREAGEAMGRGA